MLPYSRVIGPTEVRMGFKPKKCLSCQETFQPRSGRQERCDQCRSVQTVTLPPDPIPNAGKKKCSRCGEMFKPYSNAQKKCVDCRNIVEVVQKPCEVCGNLFRPTTKQKWCDDCRADTSIDKCDCGSKISGRARWGDQWGGSCDRAEEITDRLMRKLSTHASR
jgi:hypothetical protein